MKGEFKFFNQLPAVLQQYTSTFLPNQEAAVLVSASRGSNYVFNLFPAFPMSVRQLVQLVVHGEYEKVKTMLKDGPHLPLFCQRTTVTDYSGREFDPISGFEYALWALDKHMWNDILSCLPRDKAGHLTDEGRVIVAELQRQYNRVKNEGVTYKLNGVVKTESHYDFALIKELQKQVTAQDADGDKDWDAIDTQWRDGVGGVQCLLPMHVVDEYCSNTPFNPLPQFVSRARPARAAREFYNWLSNSWEFWFSRDSKLGVKFGIFKGDGVARAGEMVMASGATAAVDLIAITALCETRKSDFIKLEAQLEALLILEEQPSPGV